MNGFLDFNVIPYSDGSAQPFAPLAALIEIVRISRRQAAQTRRDHYASRTYTNTNEEQHLSKMAWAEQKDKPRKPPFSFRLVGQLGQALREGKAAQLNNCALDAIRLLLLSGCRRQEVLGLRWEEVDIEAQCLRLADTKSGPQVRPVGRTALDVLAGRERQSDFVFPSTTSSGHYVGLPRIWSAVSARAQLNGMTLHGLRHWYTSAAAEMNFSELTIAGLLGHSVRGVTARYATTPDSALKAAANEISQKLADALDGT